MFHISLKVIFYSLCCFVVFSCVSSKEITYFQSVDAAADQITSKTGEVYVPHIKARDILSVTVSSLSREANEMFNPIIQTMTYSNQMVGTIAPQPVTGFKVDDAGDITLPLLGKMHVAGLTSEELADTLTEQLQIYLESPTVLVRIANYTISILGEVLHPAMYTVPNERITLPEALALAGDLTIYGKRKNILIIREEDGKRQFARIDLTGRDVFNSPYYYLRSGDVVYVEARSGKITSTDRVYQMTPIILSALTFLTVIFTNLK